MVKRIDGLDVVATTPGCEGKNCPTIYRKDSETFVVQGYIADGLFSSPLPSGEHAVEIPASLIAQLSRDGQI